MTAKYHTVVIGGGCLGCACAFSVQRNLGKKSGQVAILEKQVLGAGLSSRHSAIVRSANASPMAARMAKLATGHWKRLKPLWGVNIPYEQPGAIWISANLSSQGSQKWRELELSMQRETIAFSMISHQEVAELSDGAVNTVPEESYYYEPEVLQLDSPQILNALQTAARINKIDVLEHCQVYGFECGSDRITALQTSQGKIYADNIVNAAGGWSSDLFASLGITLAVALEPVYAANFLVSAQDIPEGMPIIADFVNRAYFRRWRGSILHMHQPRSRAGKDVASAFSRAAMNPEGANVIYDAFSFNVNHQQLDDYFAKVQNRFPKIGKPVYAGGYRSFFDITPDLKFILGADSRITNLYHCLGAGQSLKYAPLFGELIAELITEQRILNETLSIDEFSIARFADRPLSEFWLTEQTEAHSL
ncbi:MAG TPA: FAD-binding oxidoreductase [Methylomicrobium sp.]|nr:FAD-binding oxidoreductase [Methylomicrobium sp.]